MKHFGDFVNSHLTQDLHVSRPHVHHAVVHLVLASNQDVVPLSKLCVSDLLLNVTLLTVNFSHETLLMQVKVDRLAIVGSFV